MINLFERCAQVLARADDDERIRLQQLGATTLQSIEDSPVHQHHSVEDNAVHGITLAEKKIQLGQLFLNSGLHDFDRSTLFGSLMEFNQTSQKKISLK